MSQIVLKFIKLKSKDITLDSINKIKKLDFVNHSKQKTLNSWSMKISIEEVH